MSTTANVPDLATILERIETAQSKIVSSTPELDAATANNKANDIPEIAVGPSQGQFLSILCRSVKAKKILEVGTLGAYSTLWLASSAPDAHVTSIELKPKHRDVALQNLKSVQDRTQIILGSALEILPQFIKDGKVFDFVFIDANWDAQGEYYDLAVKLTRSGGIVYVDNAVRNITEEEETPGESQNLVVKVQGDKRVVATLLPTTQTWRKTTLERTDGFLLAYVL